MPPTVASNATGSRARVIRRSSPSGVTSSSARTCAPKAPSRWWFLPWTSAATAPPTVTWRVPGTTAGNQPCGSTARARSPSDVPAATVASPATASSSRTPASPVQSRTSPPAFCAASPYARPRPPAHRPRGPAAAMAAAPSPRPAGRWTRARDGEVRPQPVSSSSAPAVRAAGARGSVADVDTDGHEHDPRDGADLQPPVAEDQVLWGAAAAPVDEQAVAQHEHGERDDGQLGPRTALEVGLVEGPDAVRGQGHPEGDGPDLAEVLVGVLGQRGPRARLPVPPDLAELG